MRLRKFIQTNGEIILQQQNKQGEWLPVPVVKEPEIFKRPELIYVQGAGNIKDFLIGKYPVTNELWNSVMDTHKEEDANLPVVNVNWYDAIEFCNKLSEKEGLDFVYTSCNNIIEGANGYRLPAENEWEYAAKGGLYSKGFKYAGSNDLNEVGWFDKNSEGKTHPVGQLAPNELNIYDMSGNVWEWCEDKFGTHRVYRGGSRYSLARFCRVAFRFFNNPYSQDDRLGFRIIRYV